VVARELTKIHEEVARGRLSELAARFSCPGTARGEMVLIIDRTVIETETRENASNTIGALVAALESEGVEYRAALKRVAKTLGISRDEAYRRLSAERSVQKS
jgi:16S rRNA (cytidine1402-2'-O)-methyltransferase